MLFLQPSLTLSLVPRAGPLIQFGAPKPPGFALGSWDTEQVQKCLCEARIVGGRRGPSKGSQSFFLLLFHEREKSDFLFLGCSLPGLYHCPTEGVSVTGEVGARAEMKYQSGQY